ncbi:GrpB family protein [Virgibacillus soli]|uniref:GrpB family protein n=1 Tax=Paracerasibacillus soli TaxID=480284 RepID=A0ABU5CPU6_9BACI|nr:GrpB family protein [Virgibacillus soli]MDY0407483.1 GrpB family protein [Virgibacillus soli]
MLGLPKGQVYLTKWTEEWEKEFIDEKGKIEKLLQPYAVAIHHIGSTSVKGLSAKPIIDIAIELNQFNEGEHCVMPLKGLGYAYKGTNILPDRHYFSKGEPRTHQIHMYESGNKYLLKQLHFRDYLRLNRQAKIEYEQLKQRLAKTYANDKHQYAAEKTNFITSLLKEIQNL